LSNYYLFLFFIYYNIFDNNLSSNKLQLIFIAKKFGDFYRRGKPGRGWPLKMATTKNPIAQLIGVPDVKPNIAAFRNR